MDLSDPRFKSKILDTKVKLLKKYPKKKSKSEQARLWLDLSREYEELQNRAGILSCLEEAYILAPNDKTLLKIAKWLEKLNQLEKLAGLLPLIQRIQMPEALLVQARWAYRRKKYTQAISHLDQIYNTKRSSISDNLHIDALYLKAIILEDLNEYDKAWACCEQVSKFKKELTDRTSPKLVEQSVRLIESLKHKTDTLSSNQKNINFESPTTYFIVGFPRSGTTLIDQILHTHYNVSVVEEKNVIKEIYGNFIDSLVERPGLDNNEIMDLQRRYIERLNSYTDKRSDIVIDKLPLNIMYLDLIQSMMPNAKFIIMLRDPRDVVISNFFQKYYLNKAMYQTIQIETCIDFYDIVMKFYLQAKKILNLNYLEVRYEDLIANPKCEVIRVCKYLDISFEEKMLEFHNTAKTREIHTPSYHQVIKPLYTNTIGRWKHYAKHIKSLDSKLIPYIEKFGYKK